jgi:glycosyltransferase involved in cell wall biosynthesis
MSNEKRVLMCGSSLDYQGGMVSVAKNYLSWQDWDEFSIEYVPTHVPGSKARVAVHFAATLPKISRMLRGYKVDLVHLHVAERGSFFRKAIIARKAERAGIPVVLHHHAAEFEEFYSALDRRGKNYVGETLEHAEVNLVLSESVRKVMLGHFPNAQFQVLYNAVPSQPINAYDACSADIVFMGCLGNRKGTYDLIRAFAQALPALPGNCHLVLCGDGEVEKADDLISELGLRDRAECRGWVGPTERADVLRHAGLYVLPSYNEGLPMSILEAMSYGVPVISTNIAAIPEVVRPGKTGALVTPGDIDALASEIERLMGDTALRSELSENSYGLISRSFSLGPHVERLKDVWRTLC